VDVCLSYRWEFLMVRTGTLLNSNVVKNNLPYLREFLTVRYQCQNAYDKNF